MPVAFIGIALAAQPRSGIRNGPVTTINKLNIPLLKKYESQAMYVQKGDWLVVMARSSGNPVRIDIYDRQRKKYIYSFEDTAKHNLWAKTWRTVLAVQLTRTDSFDVLCKARETESSNGDDEFSSSVDDTVFADISIARLNSGWQPSDTNWGILQRLNYLASHWTAGFRTVARTYDEEKAARDGKIREYFPEAQVAIDPRLNCSIFPLGMDRSWCVSCTAPIPLMPLQKPCTMSSPGS